MMTAEAQQNLPDRSVSGFKLPSPLWGLFFGIVLTAPLLAISFLLYIVAGVPFAPLEVFDLLARILPGAVITAGIDGLVAVIRGLNIGRTDVVAKAAERGMAILMFVGLGAVFGLIYFVLARALHRNPATVKQDSPRSGAVFGLIVGVLTAIVVFTFNKSADQTIGTLFILAAFTVWGYFLGMSYGTLAASRAVGSAAAAQFSTATPITAGAPVMTNSAASVQQVNRRQFLIQVGAGAATLTVLGAGVGAFLDISKTAAAQPEIDVDGMVKLPNANDPVAIAPGTRPEYTRQMNHYRIDINAGDGPKLDEATYKLKMSGLVENPKDFSLAEVRALPAVNEYITMGCISNPVGGDLISNTLWTGTSMQNLLEIVKPKPEAKWLKIDAEDGFTEYLEVQKIKDDPRIMLAWNWDNAPLMQKHGFPLRIHVPNVYGMKQPKWITSMEFVENWDRGYWVARGWDKEATIRTVSVIDTIATASIYKQGDKQFVPLGGIAWAGPRQIAKVQVQIDGGDWVDAQLRAPVSDRAWTLWRYDWAFTEGDHTFKVRCIEADGTMQIEAVDDPHPAGATGYHQQSQFLRPIA